jgi:hypothetical protein
MIKAEGWCRDPFELHEARWFSDGRPTALVRDARAESHDPPPADHYDGPVEEIHGKNLSHGEDLRRADDQAETSRDDGAETAFEGLIGRG